MTVRPRNRSTAEGGDRASPTQPVRAREPFERFYEREYRSVVGLAYALSGSSSGSEDLAQEAFLTAHRNWDRIGAYDKPEAWVRRIVANEGVERIFPLHSPRIAQIEVVRRGDARRAKLYYLRDRVGKSRRLRDQRRGLKHVEAAGGSKKKGK